MLGQGNLDQRAAQAAAWHFANGMSWDELAAKKIHHLGGRPDEPYFSRSEIQQAMRIGSQVVQLAKDLPPDNSQFTRKPDPTACEFDDVSIPLREVNFLAVVAGSTRIDPTGDSQELKRLTAPFGCAENLSACRA